MPWDLAPLHSRIQPSHVRCLVHTNGPSCLILQTFLNLSDQLGLTSACPIPLTQWPRQSKRMFSFYIFYCCSSTVVSNFPKSLPHNPDIPHFPPLILPLIGFFHVSFIHASENSSLFPLRYPISTPLWLLSVCSLFWCFWLYFACLVVLLIRFLL